MGEILSQITMAGTKQVLHIIVLIISNGLAVVCHRVKEGKQFTSVPMMLITSAPSRVEYIKTTRPFDTMKIYGFFCGQYFCSKLIYNLPIVYVFLMQTLFVAFLRHSCFTIMHRTPKIQKTGDVHKRNRFKSGDASVHKTDPASIHRKQQTFHANFCAVPATKIK